MSSTDERHHGDPDQREDALRRAYAANHPDTKAAETGRAIGRALAAAVAQVDEARAETSRTVEAATERAAQVLCEANDALHRLFDQAFNTAGHDEGRDRSVRDRDAVQAALARADEAAIDRAVSQIVEVSTLGFEQARELLALLLSPAREPEHDDPTFEPVLQWCRACARDAENQTPALPDTDVLARLHESVNHSNRREDLYAEVMTGDLMAVLEWLAEWQPAPGEAETEWGVAYRAANDVLFVDDDVVDRRDAEQRVEWSDVYDFVVCREVGPWTPVRVTDTERSDR